MTLVSISSASLSRQRHVGHLQLHRPVIRCERKNGPRLPKRLASTVLIKRAISLQPQGAPESICFCGMEHTPLWYVKRKAPWQRHIFPEGFPSSIVCAGAFHFRVRDGNGWFHSAQVTKKPSA